MSTPRQEPDAGLTSDPAASNTVGAHPAHGGHRSDHPLTESLRARLEDPDWARLLSKAPSRAATVISNVLDPPVTGAAALLVAALLSGRGLAADLGWFALAVLFVAGIPLGFLALFVHRGWVADRHVVVRRERNRLLAIAAVSALVGVLVLHVAGAPAKLMACMIAMLVALGMMGAVNTVVKASGHVGTMSGAAGLVALAWTPWTLVATVPMTLAVAWARLRAGRHSLAQVIVGMVVGVACSMMYHVLPH